MKRPDFRGWRAPAWAPLWLRRAFPGRWTEAEIADIRRRAHERYTRMLMNGCIDHG